MAMRSAGRGAPTGRGGSARPGGGRPPVDQMSKLTITPSDDNEIVPVLPQKTAPGNLGRKIMLDTNMWELKLPQNTPLFRYEVHVKAVINTGKGQPKTREMAGGGKNDFFYLYKRDICYFVFFNMVEQFKDVFSTFFAFVYDKAKILYSLKRLDENKLKNAFRVNMPAEEREGLKVKKDVSYFEVEISPVTEDFTSIMGDFAAAVDLDLRNFDRSHIQLLELATSQGIFYNLNYLSYGKNHFPKNGMIADRKLGEDRLMARGISKNVRPVEGADGQGKTVVMQLDFKAGFFWKEQSVLELAAAVLNVRINYNTEFTGGQRDKLSDTLQDLVVETTYGEPRQITATGLSHKKICEIHFPDEQHNSELSIIDYFGKRYGKKIFYQRLPCIKEYCQKTRHHNFYPIEYCRLLAGQRIEMSKQTPEQMAVAVPKAALKPSDRWPEIEKLAEAANIFENDFLAELGIEVSFSGTKVEGRVLTPPEIECKLAGKSKILKVKPKADWDPQNCQFFMPGTCPDWGVAIFKNKDGSQPISEQEMAKFVTLLVKAGQARGMIIKEPKVAIHSLMEEQLEKFGDTFCKPKGVRYFMFVTGKKQGGAPFHDKVKQYFEEELCILTQQLVVDRTILPVLRNQNNSRQLIQNILFKMNTKLGGLNYSIVIPGILKTNRMYVSYDVSHPTHLRPDQQMSIPSVVGLCTNSGNHPLKLTGNYGYQRMRQEEVGDLLKHLMTQQLNIWKECHKDWPAEVIVLRDGISEGQYRKVLEQELPLIFAAFDQLGAPRPKIEVFVVEKRHNARFKPENINAGQGAKDQNVPPGTVIDKDVVHATHEEFYMCTHLTIQGTAKIPRYDKLWNGIGLSKNEIQSIIFGLAYNHQIIAQPVSLPATLYAAHELAKRGKNTRKAKIGREESSSGFSSDSGLARAGSLHSVNDGDDVANFRLGIKGPLAQRKFWA